MEYVVTRSVRRIGSETEKVLAAFSGGPSGDRLRDAKRTARVAAVDDPGTTYRVREGRGEEAPLMYEVRVDEKSYGGTE